MERFRFLQAAKECIKSALLNNTSGEGVQTDRITFTNAHFLTNMQSLQTRLSELESENAILHQANDEAAMLLETLAPENEDLKRELHHIQEAHGAEQKELELLRRKHDTEKTELERLRRTVRTLRNQVNDQEGKIQASSEMEKSLRQTILNLRRESKQQDVQGRPLLSLSSFYHNISMESPILTMLSSMASLHIILCKFIFPSRLSFPKVAHPLLDTLEQVNSSIRRLTDWLSLASVKQQAFNDSLDHAVIQHVETLYERVTASIKDIINPSFPVTCSSPIDVQIGLINLCTEGLNAYTSSLKLKSNVHVDIGNNNDFLLCVENLIKDYRQHQQTTREVSSNPSNLNTIPEQIQQLLQDKERAIDDALVRCQAFEQALTISRSQLQELRETIASTATKEAISDDKTTCVTESDSPTNVQSQVKPEQHPDAINEPSNETQSSDGIELQEKDAQQRSAASSAGTTPTNKSVDEATSSPPDATHSDITLTQTIRMQHNWDRLRGCYLRGALGDLYPPGGSSYSTSKENNDEQTAVDATRGVIMDTLHRARLAAANAHVIKLHPISLTPTTCGTTMSRRALVESISVAKRVLKRTENQRPATEIDEIELTLYKRKDASQILRTLIQTQF